MRIFDNPIQNSDNQRALTRVIDTRYNFHQASERKGDCLRMWKRRGQWFGGRYFRVLLFSSLLFFFIPLTIWVTVYYTWQSNAYVQRRSEEIRQSATLTTAHVDQYLSSVLHLPKQIGDDDAIMEFALSSYKPVNNDDLRKRLRTYASVNPLVKDIFFYVKQHGVVYTQHQVLPTHSDTIGITVDGQDYAQALLRSDLLYRFMWHWRTRPMVADEFIVVYSAPLRYQADGISIACSVSLDLNELARIMSRTAVSDNVQPVLSILDTAGDTIYFSGDIPEETMTRQLYTAFVEGRDSVRIDAGEYRVYHQPSGVAEWIYFAATPSTALYAGFWEDNLWLLLLMIATILLGILALVVFLKAVYGPIHSVYAIARKHIAKDASGPNEMQEISRAIRYLEGEIGALTDKLINSQDAVLRAFLQDVINGATDDQESIYQQAQELGIPLTGVSYLVLLIQSGRASDETRSDPLLGIELADIQFMPVGAMERIYHMYLCLLPEGAALEDVIDVLREWSTAQSESTDRRYIVGVGNPCAHLTKIAHSFMEAKAALDLQSVLGDNIVPYAKLERMNAFHDEAFISLIDSNALICAICEGARHDIHAYISGVQSLLREKVVSLSHARRICFEMNNAVTGALRQLGQARPAEREYDLTQVLLEMQTFEDAIDFLYTLERAIFERVSGAGGGKKDIASIERIMRENYRNPDFSIKSVAAQVGVSFAYFSQLFKSQKGLLPVEYITKLRMEEASELLRKTDMSVGDIMTHVGYYSISSFIKRFRTFSDMTPGEYRTKYREK